MTSGRPTRTVVVAAASRHGSTEEVAARLVATLTERLSDEWVVVRADPTDTDGFADADAVVLGSAIYFGRWLRPATQALAWLRDHPPRRIWLFSTGPVAGDEAEIAAETSADALADLAEGDEHMVFGGRLDPAELGPVERLVVRAVKARPGDHRDWSAVDRWAVHIADELEPHVVPSSNTRAGSGGSS
ncbi:MAG: flavodoxin domain-containing protein [Aeromicrobium sp.]